VGGAVAGEAPHTHQVVQEKDIAYVIERFEEAVEASLIQKRIALTPHATARRTRWRSLSKTTSRSSATPISCADGCVRANLGRTDIRTAACYILQLQSTPDSPSRSLDAPTSATSV